MTNLDDSEQDADPQHSMAPAKRELPGARPTPKAGPTWGPERDQKAHVARSRSATTVEDVEPGMRWRYRVVNLGAFGAADRMATALG